MHCKERSGVELRLSLFQSDKDHFHCQNFNICNSDAQRWVFGGQREIKHKSSFQIYRFLKLRKYLKRWKEFSRDELRSLYSLEKRFSIKPGWFNFSNVLKKNPKIKLGDLFWRQWLALFPSGRWLYLFEDSIKTPDILVGWTLSVFAIRFNMRPHVRPHTGRWGRI